MLAIASLLAFVATVLAQAADPSINTPASVVQCQPAQLSWIASKTPVFISIIPGGQPSATPLEDLGQQTGTSLTWTVNIAAGTSITFQIRDSNGAVAYSAPVTIQNSSDSSCLGSSASAPPASTPAGSSAVSSATSSAVSSAVSSASVSSPAPTTTAPGSTSHASSTSSSSTRPPASATSATPSHTASNAASPNAKFGYAGLLGLAAAVVMA